ncbi:MAG: terpene cyclase/mutase family protein [Planctomycetes bacterium]|nr:terpene cyclase/mutase family protein [Planctomycetota bacterium]
MVDDHEDDADEMSKPDRRRVGLAGWLISAAVHSLLILVMTSIYFLVKAPEADFPPMRNASIDPPPEPQEKPKPERTLETHVELEAVAESDTPSPITELDLPIEHSEREEDNEAPVAKGHEEAVADSEIGGSGAFMAIGAGGGSSGMFGARSGGGKKRALARFGASKGSESAVDASLRWLKKHQSPNGMWDPVSYPANCTEDPKCEPGAPGWVGKEEGATVACSGYGVLCFLGAGYDHQTPNKYKQTVKKGLDYLVTVQKQDGRLGITNYENAIATMALAEAFAMTGDPALKGPAQRGVTAIIASQNQNPKPRGAPGKAGDGKESAYSGTGLGWDYFIPSMRNDTSITGWNVMALKSAVAAQLDVGTSMAGAHTWLVDTWSRANADSASMDLYTSESFFPYVYYSDEDSVEYCKPGLSGEVFPRNQRGQNFSCAGMVCAVFLGHRAGDLMLETLANEVMKNQLPETWPCNVYYLYYNTLGIFQVGGDRWKKWNTKVRDLLVNAQRKGDGCFDGSWDWKDGQFLGHGVGRMLTTQYCCLSLQVYYRYAQVAGAKK